MKLKNLVLTVAAASSLGVVQPTTVSKAKDTKEETKDKGGRSLVNAANIGGGVVATAGAVLAAGAAYKLSQNAKTRSAGGTAVLTRQQEQLYKLALFGGAAVSGLTLTGLVVNHMAGKAGDELTTGFNKVVEDYKGDWVVQGKDKDATEKAQKEVAGVLGVKVDAVKGKIDAKIAKVLVKANPELLTYFMKDDKLGEAAAPSMSGWLGLAKVARTELLDEDAVKAHECLEKAHDKLVKAHEAAKNAKQIKAEAEFKATDAQNQAVTDAKAKLEEAKKAVVAEELTGAVTKAQEAYDKAVGGKEVVEDAPAKKGAKAAPVFDADKQIKASAVKEQQDALNAAKKAVADAETVNKDAVADANKAVEAAEKAITDAKAAAKAAAPVLATDVAYATSKVKDSKAKAAGEAKKKEIADAKKAFDDSVKANQALLDAAAWIKANAAKAEAAK